MCLPGRADRSQRNRRRSPGEEERNEANIWRKVTLSGEHLKRYSERKADARQLQKADHKISSHLRRKYVEERDWLQEREEKCTDF